MGGLFSIIYISGFAFAIEPIGTIGQPFPEQHAFLLNPETWIPFRLTDARHVTVRIYSPTGQLVRRLSPGIMPAGDHSSQSEAIHWDGRNQIGEPVSSGIYLYTINAGDFSATRKMLIRK